MIIVDIVTTVIDRAVTEDMGGIILIIARRPQPPPASVCATWGFISIVRICSLCLCISCRCTFSCIITIEILLRLVDAEQKYFIRCCIAGTCVVARIFIGRYGCVLNQRPFFFTECCIKKGIIQPFTQRALLPCDGLPFFVVRLTVKSFIAYDKYLIVFFC